MLYAEICPNVRRHNDFSKNNEMSNIEFPNLELAIVLTDDSIDQR
jgi:hypothetical protein